MIKTVFFTVFAIIEGLTIKQWLVCSRFADNFHFSSLDLSLRIQEAASNDKNVPLFVVRLFHNKAEGAVLDGIKSFIKFWDVIFLTNLLSIVGLFGLIIGLWYAFRKKNKKILFVLTLLCVIQVLEVYIHPNINFPIKLFVFWVLHQVIMWFGLWNFYNNHRKKTTILIGIIVLIASLIWLKGSEADILRYCFA